MNEQQVMTLVERVGDTLEPDVARLVAGGAARGRARRRRRRATATVLAGTAAVAVTTSVAFALPHADEQAPVARELAVAPGDLSQILATLLPGAKVAEPEQPFQFQVPRGTVRWQGATVTLTIDERSVGIDRPARERCESLSGRACAAAPGGAWYDEGGLIEFDRVGGRPSRDWVVVDVYEPDGYVVSAAGERGDIDVDRLRDIALDDVWFR